ncbi:MAG TPA: VOC family protein [Myxococcota bacterium]
MNDIASKIRLEGLTLTVASVEKSLAFYAGKLGLDVAWNAAPEFAMVRHGSGTIGLLCVEEARKAGVEDSSFKQKGAIHVELSTDDLDGLYVDLLKLGIEFHEPPHDEPWERSMTAFDPDGYAVEFAQGKRGRR